MSHAAEMPRHKTTEQANGQRILRVLHVGVAQRGLWPLERCKPEIGFQPTALCDVSEAALEQARTRTGIGAAQCYTDFDRALAEADVDCAILCTPTVFHVPMAKKCIAAGLPVLMEKGMAPDWHNALDLVRAATASKAVVAIAQNYRYHGGERTIKRALHDPGYKGYVGEAHLVAYSDYRVRPLPRTLTYPFASVWDMSCHHFDNMLFWLGPVRAMTAQSWSAGWSAYEHDNNTTAHIEFENGTRVHYLHIHDAARGILEVQVHGQRGAVVNREGQLTFNERPLEQFGKRDIIPLTPEPTDGETDLLRDFHAYITQGREPGISARNNLETMAMCEMMVRSINQKRRVERHELNATS